MDACGYCEDLDSPDPCGPAILQSRVYEMLQIDRRNNKTFGRGHSRCGVLLLTYLISRGSDNTECRVRCVLDFMMFTV